MKEIEQIKERLAKDNCTLESKTLERAVLLPAEQDYQPGIRVYPTPELGLMENPFPPVKKGKKKKKKRA